MAKNEDKSIFLPIAAALLTLPLALLPYSGNNISDPGISYQRTERTETQKKRDNMEALEDRVNNLRLTYGDVVDRAGLKQTLPTEYRILPSNVDVVDNYQIGDQSLNEGGDYSGKHVQVYISKRDAYEILEK